MTEEKILQFQEGDRKAFNEVFEQFYGAIYNFCKRLTNSPQDGADITQETFLKLWERRQNFNTLLNIKAFLFITARNACFNLLTGKYYRMVIHTDEADFPAGMEKDAHSKVIEAEVLRAIDEEVQQLTDMERRVFELKFYERLKGHEIAGILGISKEAVRVHSHNALTKLRTRVLRSKLQLLIFFIISLVGGFKKNI